MLNNIFDSSWSDDASKQFTCTLTSVNDTVASEERNKDIVHFVSDSSKLKCYKNWCRYNSAYLVISRVQVNVISLYTCTCTKYLDALSEQRILLNETYS